MADVKLQIEVKDIEPVKSLIRLLSENFSDLPKDVQLAIYALVGDGDIELSVGEDAH
jgi:hypothetical protein